MGQPLTLTYKKDEIICAMGEHDHSLYYINSGSMMIFVTSGTQVTPLAYLNAGEYFGEMSFFSPAPRSANAIAMDDCTLIKINEDDIDGQFPSWLKQIATSMTQKLRKGSNIIREKGIRKKNVETLKPLSIEKQRHYFDLLKSYFETKSI